MFPRALNVVFPNKTVTIFAYGVTSSGKTHTMQGSPTEPGIIPRVMHVRTVADIVGVIALSYEHLGTPASPSPRFEQEAKL